MSIAVTIDGFPVDVQQWRFPCGEAGIKIGEGLGPCAVYACVDLIWEGNDDLMALGQVVDALRHRGVSEIDLYIPYFPYSRQDRRCNTGEGHALKVVGQFINALGFNQVTTLDAHSSVLEAVVDRLRISDQALCALELPRHDILIAPDAGAAKKIYSHLQVEQGYAKVLIADKKRDATGKIVGMSIPGIEDLFGKKVCVVDDLCDGGATFIELAKAMGSAVDDCKEFNLYVTHGFFTKGVDVLTDYYDNIYVANLMAKIDVSMYPEIKEI